jgi:CubicO group peptidase (beta-lactamase class C family)
MKILVRIAFALWLCAAALLSWGESSPMAAPPVTPAATAPPDQALAQRLVQDMPQVRSLIIDRAGGTLFEYHRAGLGANDTHYVRSITKSVTATLIGIALGQGLLSSLDLPLHALLPELAEEEGTDAQAADVTLSQLMTMTAGFRWDDRTFHRARWLMQPNQVHAAMQRPVARPHGALFNYDTPSSHLLSGGAGTSHRRLDGRRTRAAAWGLRRALMCADARPCLTRG